MKGFFNTLLRIDLEREDYSYERLSDGVLSKTLGGKGLERISFHGRTGSGSMRCLRRTYS